MVQRRRARDFRLRVDAREALVSLVLPDVARAPRAGCYGRQDRGSGPRPVRADSVPQVELLIRQSRRRCYGIMRGYQTQTICTKLGLV